MTIGIRIRINQLNLLHLNFHDSGDAAVGRLPHVHQPLPERRPVVPAAHLVVVVVGPIGRGAAVAGLAAVCADEVVEGVVEGDRGFVAGATNIMIK